MRTPLEFLQEFESRYPRLQCFLETEEDRRDFYNSAQGSMVICDMLKEYALEIASDAYDEGFTYGIGSHKDFIQTGMNKFEYSQKLHNEL